jgi:hypothetical protein
MPDTPSQTHSRAYLGLGLLWFGVSLMLARTGRLESLRPPVPQLVLVALTVFLVILTNTARGLRAWLQDLDLRWLLSLHVTRLFIGLYFLILVRSGDLPAPFGVPAGWGDAFVGLLALLLIASGPPQGAGRRRLYVSWNWLGLVDLLFVVGTAARLALADPPSMIRLLRLPLSLLPTFWVPILLASHVVLIRRVGTPRDSVATGTA